MPIRRATHIIRGHHRAHRGGECGPCTSSDGIAAFEWRTTVPRERHSAIFVLGTQITGAAASRCCALRIGADLQRWADVEAGLVRSIDGEGLDLYLTCFDATAGLASASCLAANDVTSLRIDLETGPLPAPNIAATGPYDGAPGFDRGMQTTQHCGNNPESWVRGSAKLDTETGTLAVDVQLETDSVAAGPKGKLTVYVIDADSHLRAVIESSDIGIGGKPPGPAVSRTYSSHVQLGSYLAKRAAKLTLHAVCTGIVKQLYGVGNDPTNAFGLTVQHVPVPRGDIR